MDAIAVTQIDPILAQWILWIVVLDHSIGTVVSRVALLIQNFKRPLRSRTVPAKPDGKGMHKVAVRVDRDLLVAQVDDRREWSANHLQCLARANLLGIGPIQFGQIFPGDVVFLGDAL